MTELQQILHELRNVNKRLERIETACRLSNESVAARAKQLGISRSTDYRRRRRARLKLMAS